MLSQSLLELGNTHPFDIFITVTSLDKTRRDQILSDFPGAVIRAVESRGQDILPFVRICKEVFPLNYHFACKVHHNNSTNNSNKAELEAQLFMSLLSNKPLLETFLENEKLGLSCPQKYIRFHTSQNIDCDQTSVDALASQLGVRYLPSIFPQGSMYWFRPKALHGIENIPDSFFDIERGSKTRAIPQSFERLIALFAKSNGFELSGKQ